MVIKLVFFLRDGRLFVNSAPRGTPGPEE